MLVELVPASVDVQECSKMPVNVLSLRLGSSKHPCCRALSINLRCEVALQYELHADVKLRPEFRLRHLSSTSPLLICTGFFLACVSNGQLPFSDRV